MHSRILHCLTTLATIVLASALALGQDRQYEPTWESLANYEVPEWYRDAKFGIWPIWGVYSVPAFRGDHAAEWYGRWMYCVEKGEAETDARGRRGNQYFEERGLKQARHHRQTYGDPSVFGYKDFIPMFQAEKWDPDDWAQLAVDSGARFFTMISEFHDGFAMYDSSYTKWDSVGMGPKRDITGELERAVRARGLRFGVSNHFAWNYEFYRYNHVNGFDATDPANYGLYSNGETIDRTGKLPRNRQLATEWHVRRWWNRTIELAEKYKPDLYYFDFGWGAEPFARRRPEFAAFLYNHAIEWGYGKFPSPGVVLNYKGKAIPDRCAVLDLERGLLAGVRELPWQTDTSISNKSWGYSTTDEYKTPNQLIDMLMDIVSKNGVLMLAFGPRADGTIPDEYRTPLLEIGKWLKQCGEAVYETRPYVVYGEGPTVPGSALHGDENSYTAQDIRFTRNKANTVLYATVLGWPRDPLTIKSLRQGAFDTSRLVSVRMLGTRPNLKWRQDETGLTVTLPAKPFYGSAYPLKLEFDGAIPPVAARPPGR